MFFWQFYIRTKSPYLSFKNVLRSTGTLWVIFRSRNAAHNASARQSSASAAQLTAQTACAAAPSCSGAPPQSRAVSPASVHTPVGCVNLIRRNTIQPLLSHFYYKGILSI